jgi:hypothetical protein
MKPVKLSPAVCQVIYVVSVVAAAFIPVLVTAQWVDPELGASLDKAIASLASIAGGGAGLAAVRVSRQMANGTFQVPGGTSAEQLAIAARNYASDEARRQEAVAGVLAAIPGAVAAEPITVGDVEPSDIVQDGHGGSLR